MKMVSDARRVALGSIFGAAIVVFVGFVPAPTSDFLIGFQAFLLAISFLVVGRGGATYVWNSERTADHTREDIILPS